MSLDDQLWLWVVLRWIADAVQELIDAIRELFA